MGFLADVYPEVRRQLGIAETKRQYVHDVAKWAKDILDVDLWSKQIEIANAVRTTPRVAVAAGHGVGKSFSAGVLCLWWWDTHPLMEEETFIATTAPSKDQVDLIWAVIRSLHAKMKLRYDKGVIDHYLPGYITGDNKFKLPDGQMLGQGRKPPDSKSDVAFQGRHATYLLAIGDEAVGLSAGYLNALEVIAVGTHNKVLLLANPTDPSCAMARLWPDAEGRGGDPNWVRIHISVFDSPLLSKEPGWEKFRDTGISDQKFIDRMEVRYGGKDDPRYIARILGQWAWDNGAGLFPEEIIAKSMRTMVQPDYDNPNPRFGVDVARMGVDSTVVYIAVEGWVWETDPETGEPTVNTGVPGIQFRKVEEWRRAPLTGHDPENLGSAQRIDKLALEYAVNAVNIDAGGGYGQGVFDAIIDEWDANPRRQSYDLFEMDGNSRKNIDTRVGINLRAYTFSELKRRMAVGEVDIDIEDEELLDELRGIRAKIVNGSALQIESKDDMKKRGAKSPDHADAVWYAMVDTTGLSSLIKPGDEIQRDPNDYIPDAYSQAWNQFAIA